MFGKMKIKKYKYLLKKSFNNCDFQKAVKYSDYILNYDDCNLEALYYKADSLVKLGDLEGALDIADLIINIKPSCNNLLIKATFIAFKQDYDIAFSLFDEILDKCPNFEKALINKCYFLYCCEQWDDIISEVNKFLENNPNNSNAYDIKAAAYESKQDFNKALIYVNKSLELDSNNVVALNRKKKILEIIDN